MGIIIFFSILAVLSWVSAYWCYTQRKFYLEHTEEMRATIVSCSRHEEKQGRCKTVYYDFEAKAINGKTYCISTLNRKARKYDLYSDIMIMVPKMSNSYNDFSCPEFSDGLNSKKQPEMPLCYESENLILSYEPNKNNLKMCNNVNDKLKRQVIIKEDVNTPFQFWLSVAMGIFFILFTIVIAVILKTKNII